MASSGAVFLAPSLPSDAAFNRTRVAVDRDGGMHAVTYLYAHGSGHPNYYAYCPPTAGCESASSWRYVHLTDDMPFAQIEVASNGRPRILFYNDNAFVNDRAVTFYRYAECNANCTTGSGWAVTDLWHSEDGGSLYSLDHTPRSFHLDAQGRPRFVYFHGTEWFNGEHTYTEYYAACDANCGNAGNWRRVRLPDYSYYDDLERTTLAVSASGRPSLVSLFHASDDRLWLGYSECTVSCATPEDWSPVALVLPVSNSTLSRELSWTLAVDGAGRPRVAAKPQTGPMWYIWCDAACSNASNWYGYTVDFGGDAEEYPTLVLDAQDRPRLAYRSDADLGYAWCEGGCETGSPVWLFVTAEQSATLNQQFPIAPPAGCLDGTWIAGHRPTLALDAAGHPRLGHDAEYLMRCYRTPQNPNPGDTFVEAKWWSSRFVFFPHPGDASTPGEPGPGTPPAALSLTAPNPASLPVRIAFDLAEAMEVDLAAYDLLGRPVAVLARGAYPAGSHEATWEGTGASAGTYVLLLRAGGTVTSRKLTVIR